MVIFMIYVSKEIEKQQYPHVRTRTLHLGARFSLIKAVFASVIAGELKIN